MDTKQREIRLADFTKQLKTHQIPLTVLAGADIRIELDLVDRLRAGEVVTLADQNRHLLLELPHEVYLPLEGLLKTLRGLGVIGILSHPERNQAILAERQLLTSLVQAGCLLQITAGSVLGTFGTASQQMAHWMLRKGLVHFVASDAHGCKRRRPQLSRAYERVAEICGEATAQCLFVDHPKNVAEGQPVEADIRPVSTKRRKWFLPSRAA